MQIVATAYVLYFWLLLAGAFICDSAPLVAASFAVTTAVAHLFFGTAAVVAKGCQGDPEWKDLFTRRFVNWKPLLADISIASGLIVGSIGLSDPMQSLSIVAISLAAFGNTFCLLDHVENIEPPQTEFEFD